MKEMEKTFIDRGILSEDDVSKMKDKAKNMPNVHISLPMIASKISSKISDILSKIGSKIGIGNGTQFQTENITDNMYGGQTIYLKTSEDMQEVEGIWIYPADYFCPMDSTTGIITKTVRTVAIHHYDCSWMNHHSMRFRIHLLKNVFFKLIGQKNAETFNKIVH